MSQTADLTESIFAATVALANADERAAYIEQACQGDAALQARVEALLRAHDRAGHLLDQPVPDGPAGTGAYTPNAQAGDVVSAQLCAVPNTRMIPLDSAAVSAFASVGITASIGQQLSSLPTSADSIDA